MLSFRVERQLRTVSNYFLLSLAVADLLIGVISMPLYTVSSLLGRWPLPHYICDLWLSLDYTMSNASVANLLIISIDRYLSVTRPLSYRIKRTPRRAAVMIAGAWIVSSITWTPWIYAWPYIEGQRKVPHDMCYIQFLQSNTVLTIVTAVMAFYLPVTIMTVLYLRIYNETRNRRRDLLRLQPHHGHNNKSAGSCSSYHLTGSASGTSSCQTTGRRQRLRQQHTVSFSFSQSETDTSLTATAAGLAVSPPPPSDSSDGAKGGAEEEEEEVWVLREDSLFFKNNAHNNNKSQKKGSNSSDNQENGDTAAPSPSAASDDADGHSLGGSRRSRRPNKRGSRSGRKESKNESKAAKTLSAILLAFVITWTPYNIFTVMNAFGSEDDKLISDMVYSIGKSERGFSEHGGIRREKLF